MKKVRCTCHFSLPRTTSLCKRHTLAGDEARASQQALTTSNTLSCMRAFQNNINTLSCTLPAAGEERQGTKWEIDSMAGPCRNRGEKNNCSRANTQWRLG
jgi:hypothetical protein